MENIAHTLFGLALARAGLDRRGGPAATAACVIGANLPDIDGVTRFFGDNDTYLVHHRGITHSFFGLAIQAVALAALLHFLARRRHVPTPGFPFLLLASALALLSHLVLDWTNTYGVRPWLPFSDERLYGDLFFIADPWLWLILGGALALQAKKGRAASLLWGSLFVALLAVIVASDRDPAWLAPVFVGAVAVLAFLRGTGFLSGSPRAARGALALVTAYAFGVAFLREEATARLAPPPGGGEPIVEFARIPQPADPTEWGVLAASEKTVLSASANAFENRAEWAEIERRLSDPRVARALETAPGRAIRHFARFLCAEIEPRDDGRSEVFLRDARYVLAPRRSGFGVRAITVGDAEGGSDAAPPAR